MLFRKSSRYRQFMFLGAQLSDPFWSDVSWRSLVHFSLDPLVQEAGVASVHVRKLKGRESESVRVGVLPWTEEAASSWLEAEGRMVDLQVFSPGRASLLRSNSLPDLYVHLQSVPSVPGAATLYTHLFHLLVETRRAERHRQQLTGALQHIVGWPSIVRAYESETKIRNLNVFEDVIRDEFMYQGVFGDSWPDLSRTKTAWRELT